MSEALANPDAPLTDAELEKWKGWAQEETCVDPNDTWNELEDTYKTVVGEYNEIVLRLIDTVRADRGFLKTLNEVMEKTIGYQIWESSGPECTWHREYWNTMEMLHGLVCKHLGIEHIDSSPREGKGESNE